MLQHVKLLEESTDLASSFVDRLWVPKILAVRRIVIEVNSDMIVSVNHKESSIVRLIYSHAIIMSGSNHGVVTKPNITGYHTRKSNLGIATRT